VRCERPVRTRAAVEVAKTDYTTPFSLWESSACEGFNSKLRDELLNGEIFYTLKDAKITIECIR